MPSENGGFMAWINLVEMNMNISLGVCEGKSNHCLISLIQKIATYTIIPLALIAFFEAVVKNLILINLANLTFTLLNSIYDVLAPKKTPTVDETPFIEVAVTQPPALAAPQDSKTKAKDLILKGVSVAVKMGLIATVVLGGVAAYNLYTTGTCASIVISNMTLSICPHTWPTKVIEWFR